MLNNLFGLYVKENLGGRFITITFEKTLTASATGSFTISDAQDGANLATWLSSDNFLLWDAFAYADPGFVKLVFVPDNESTKKVRIEATNTPTRIPFTPPKLIEVDLALEYENESQPNNLYLSFSGMKITEENYANLIDFSDRWVNALLNIDQQTFDMVKLLQNLQSLQEGEGAVWDVTTPETKRERKMFREYCKRRR